ncbi:hypothetical protein Pst134EB_005747 [Puccinia striiformis f. sp. tritici]|nr:hypothetical protein Pst134EB_005747 [Puccinia striiformis f. sp. tritici]
MSGLPFSTMDMEGGFESTTPSRPNPYASTSYIQQPNFNLQQPPPFGKTRADLFGKPRDTSNQDQMDDDTSKHPNTPTRGDPFDNLGNQTPRKAPQEPPRGPPRGPPAGYGLHNMGSPDEIPDRKPKIIKEPGLYYDGEHFMKFLGRFERTALAFKASDYDKALQIGWFVRSEELKVQLEAMDGYNEYDWKALRKSMVDSWGELDNTILYTNHDLSQVTEDLRKNGGLKNYREYKAYLGKFTPILKYLVENGHLHRKEEASRLFLSAFSPESQRSIKRALVSKGKLPKGKDGSDQPPLWEDAIKEAEFEIRAEENGGFSATNFAEANYQMQTRLDQQKGGSQRRDPNQQEFSRGNDRPTTPLYEGMICYYCLRENHTTYRCPELAKDESQGLVTRRGRDYFLPNGNQIPWNPARPIRSVVAAASADPKILEAAEKIAATRNTASFPAHRPPTPPAFKSSAQLVDWEPPQLGAENFLKNQAITRADAQKGRRNVRIQDPEDDRMDVDQEGETEERAQETTRNIPEKVWGKEKSPVKVKKSTLEEALFQELEHVKLPTTFAQLTAIAPSYTEQVIAKLQERLHGKNSATYMANEHTKVSSAMMTPHEESDPTDPCYYSCALGYVLAEVGEGKVDFMIDSGSMVNVIPRSVAEDLDLEVVQIDIPMKGIGGARCDITGVVENCQINIGRFSGPAHLFVSPKAQDCILGRPFLFDYGCTLEYHDEGETLSFKGSKGRRVSVPLARIGHGKGWNNKKDLGTNNFRPCGNIDQPSQEHRMFKKKADQSFL